MKTKVTIDEAFNISETLFGIMKSVLPDDMKLYEMKSLFMLDRFETNNLKEIKERISKDFYHVPKHILEVKIAKTLKKLISKDLIKKEKCLNDKRQAIITITKDGKELLKEIKKKVDKKWEEAYSD